MSSNKIKAAVPVVLFVMLAAIVLGIIATLPYDRPATTPTNSFLNLKNGGFIATDGSMTYYVDGKGELRCKSDPNNYYIDRDADTICPYNIGIIYRTADGAVKYSDYDGGNKRTLAKGAQQMAVSGNWVFYTDKKGELNKHFISTGETKKVGLNVDSFMISGTSVVYLKDGNLYTARTDGSEKVSFYAEKVDEFARYESYMFYTCDGVLYSFASAQPGNKQTYFEVDSFNINEKGILFYTKDGNLHSLNITDEEAEPKALDVKGKVTGGLCCLGERVYYYSSDGKLSSCLADGSEIKTVE